MIGEGHNVKKFQTVSRRMFIMGAVKVVVFSGIIIRLFSL